MATEKRKAVTAERPAKKIKFDADGKARTVENNADKTGLPKKAAKPAHEARRKMPKSSLLVEEERSFPRGGASVLTPLEQRQVRAEADRDVLFEEAGKSKVVREEYGEDEGDNPAQNKGTSKKRRKSKATKVGADKPEKDQIKIQGLGYKTLAVGSLVLGQVTSITSKDVALALPNNLTGYIPITAVSDVIDARIKALLAGPEDEDMADDKSEDEDDIDLKQLFRPGQYLRAYVLATASEIKNKRHIELSVNPRLANTGLAADSVANNYTVQASVKSVEDYGLVMDVGLEDDSVRGFISKKELGQQWDIDAVQPGQVMFCCVTGSASDGKVIKLSPDPLRIGETAKRVLKEAPTIDPFVPGTLTEVLVTGISAGGLTGKIMGSVDATTDVMHSGASVDRELFDKIKIGQKVVGRILYTFPDSETKKVGFSLLEHTKKFEEQTKSGKKKVAQLKSSEIVEDAKVTQVLPGIGLFFDLGSGRLGFAHISKLSDERVETLFEGSGPFALDSIHRARVLSFNPVDGVYNLSLEKSVLDRKYLKLDDVEVGALVDGKVERIILGAKGVTGILVKLEDGITGLAPEMHLSDVNLSHPEKHFRENFPVKARVLSVDPEKHQLRLTLKKTLLNNEWATWTSYASIKVGDETAGTVIKVQPNGAVLQFYGNIRAWLPVSEMSEAYIADATQHFRLGQTVKVHAKQVDAAEDELIVSCREAADLSEDQLSAWSKLSPGRIVSAQVSGIVEDSVTVDVNGFTGIIKTLHLTDGAEDKGKKLKGSLRVGQKLSEAVVLAKNENQHLLTMTAKPSLLKAAKAKRLITNTSDARIGTEAYGFVRNITPDGIFVEFAAAVVAYLPKTQISKDKLALPAFGYRKDMSISARVLTVDDGTKRIALTMRELAPQTPASKVSSSGSGVEAIKPVDGVTKTLDGFVVGMQTQARVTSVKDTQLNVLLADNIRGRIDVSEAFESWDDIKDTKRPLSVFKAKQIIPVKVLGMHDARNHKFLPISHRQGKVPIFELSARSTEFQSESDLLSLSNIEIGSEWSAFINNISTSCVWVNITPNVRGRIEFMSLTDDASALQNVSEHFPIGSALRVKVKGKDVDHNRLDLESATQPNRSIQTYDDLSVGAILPGKVKQVTEHSVLVALSDAVNGIIGMTDIADDYSTAITTSFNKNDIISVCVISVDLPNKRAFLSTRPSKLLSSSLPVKDVQITSINQVSELDILRGFVKLVRSNGLIVALGPRVEAFVRVSDLSDGYIKDWQSEFSLDQLVRGKILAVDPALNHIQMSLKASHVDKDYVPPKKLEDMVEGDIVTAKVRKIADFGLFIDVDNTLPRVSGLCHRTEIADAKVTDVAKLFDEGDAVKAKVLKVDLEKRKISFGLKASYFAGEAAESEDEEMLDGDENDGVALDVESAGGGDLDNILDAVDLDESESEDELADKPAVTSTNGGLKTSGFDWSGSMPSAKRDRAADDSDSEDEPNAKVSKKDSQSTFVDRTGDLDLEGPQSSADYERLLLSSPHDSQLWMAYMAHHLRLSEVQAARDIGRRALSTIPLREVDEKLNIWIALLNLEVSYSTNDTLETAGAGSSTSSDSLEAVFREACAVQDSYTMHLHLASIFTSAGHLTQADLLYQSMLSSNPSLGPSPFCAPVATAKATKAFRAQPDLWLTYANFLFEQMHDAARARALLSRALQSVPERARRDLTLDFARLEFKHPPTSDPERGRTLLEGVLSEWPRLAGAWDAWLDAETAVLAGLKGDERADQLARVRRLWERVVAGKLKTRRAKHVFKRWREFEERYGDAKAVERVMGLAKEWVEKARERGEEE